MLNVLARRQLLFSKAGGRRSFRQLERLVRLRFAVHSENVFARIELCILNTTLQERSKRFVNFKKKRSQFCGHFCKLFLR
jgi:hypothetical protein